MEYIVIYLVVIVRQLFLSIPPLTYDFVKFHCDFVVFLVVRIRVV